MNVRPLLLLLGVLPGCASPRAASIPTSAVLAITHATVIDVESGRLLPNQTVLVAGSRILEVLPAVRARIPTGARIIDATGKFLIPGLWDAHVHLSATGQDALPLLIAYGVTSVRDLGGQLEEIVAIRKRVQSGELIGPRILTSGPLLEGTAWMNAAYQIAPPNHPMWVAAPRVIASRENVQTVVDSLKSLGVDLIKSRNVWGDDFLALADAAERAGVPLASHNPNRVHMLAAARRGLDSFEHAESIWGDFDTLSVADRERMFQLVGETGALVVPTLVADVGLIVSSDSVLLAAIADTLGRLDARNRSLPRQMRTLWAEAVAQRRQYGAHPAGTFGKITRDVQAMHRAGILMMAGTDIGGIPLVYPGSSVPDELELLVREGGLTALAALQSATRNPPRFFNMQNDLGTVESGRRADLILLDANPLADISNTRKIAGVILDGRYLDRQMLDGLLAGAERSARPQLP